MNDTTKVVETTVVEKDPAAAIRRKSAKILSVVEKATALTDRLVEIKDRKILEATQERDGCLARIQQLESGHRREMESLVSDHSTVLQRHETEKRDLTVRLSEADRKMEEIQKALDETDANEKIAIDRFSEKMAKLGVSLAVLAALVFGVWQFVRPAPVSDVALIAEQAVKDELARQGIYPFQKVAVVWRAIG